MAAAVTEDGNYQQQQTLDLDYFYIEEPLYNDIILSSSLTTIEL